MGDKFGGPEGKLRPKIVGELDNDLIIFFRLVKSGYGNFFEVQKMTATEVLQALYYEKFLVDYEETYLELNKKK